SGVDVSTRSTALTTLDSMASKLDSLNTVSGNIGSSMSRLQAALGTLTSRREYILAASARIADADIASESSHLLRLQILQQAGQSVLAEANQQPRLALDLLKERRTVR